MEKYYIAIPDIHGEAGLLKMKIEDCENWIKYVGMLPKADVQFVFLGDYIDRGEGHEAVLSIVKDRVEKFNDICLIGNHENMMLGTADRMNVKFPEGKDVRVEKCSDLWQANDGIYTCIDMFGNKTATPDKPAGYGYHVNDYIPDILNSWMYKFLKEHGKLKYETRNIFFSHAPQSEKIITDDTLLWGNKRDYRDSRGEAIFKVPGNKIMAVHGHMHMSREKIYFPRIFNFDHAGIMRTVVMCDSGCGCHPNGELHAVVIREREWETKGGIQSSVGIIAIL